MATEKDYDAALGQVIRQTRLMRGLAQTELAKRVGITFQQIQKYEKGNNRVTFGRLVKLCDAFGTTVSDMSDSARGIVEGEVKSRAVVWNETDTRYDLSILRGLQSVPVNVRKELLSLVTAMRRSKEKA